MATGVTSPSWTEMDLKLSVAAHEAGHCLYGWLSAKTTVLGVGYSLKRVTMFNLPNAAISVSGATICGWPERNRGLPETEFEHGCLCMAGLVGELLQNKRFNAGGSSRDLNQALRLSQGLVAIDDWHRLIRQVHERYPEPELLDISRVFRQRPPLNERLLLKAMYRQARGRLGRHRKELMSLASMLVVKPIMTTDDLERHLGKQVSLNC